MNDFNFTIKKDKHKQIDNKFFPEKNHEGFKFQGII